MTSSRRPLLNTRIPEWWWTRHITGHWIRPLLLLGLRKATGTVGITSVYVCFLILIDYSSWGLIILTEKGSPPLQLCGVHQKSIAQYIIYIHCVSDMYSHPGVVKSCPNIWSTWEYNRTFHIHIIHIYFRIVVACMNVYTYVYIYTYTLHVCLYIYIYVNMTSVCVYIYV